MTKSLAEKTSKIQTLEDTLKEKETAIASLKENIGKLKKIGLAYKDKFEKKEAEFNEKCNELAKIEEELRKLKENPVQTGSMTIGDSAETGSVVSAGEDKLAEAEQLVSVDKFVYFKLGLQNYFSSKYLCMFYTVYHSLRSVCFELCSNLKIFLVTVVNVKNFFGRNLDFLKIKKYEKFVIVPAAVT